MPTAHPDYQSVLTHEGTGRHARKNMGDQAMNVTPQRLPVVAATFLVGGLLLGGCSTPDVPDPVGATSSVGSEGGSSNQSSPASETPAGPTSSGPEPENTTSPTQSTPTQEPVDVLPPGTAELLPEVEGTTVEVGDLLRFRVDDPSQWTWQTDNTAVLGVELKDFPNSANTWISGEARASGVARVTLTNTAAGQTWVVTVTVAERGTLQELPSEGVVLLITPETQSASIEVGESAFLAVADPAQWAVVSSDPAVVRVEAGFANDEEGRLPQAFAESPGKATVTLSNAARGDSWEVTITVGATLDSA